MEVSGQLKKADFISDQEIRWCPACGDWAILSTMQATLAKLPIPKENHVFVSGIGCSSRFPYYLSTYGFHTIHGRAPAVATGVKCTNSALKVWVVTGDGDGLSIGGNHLLHAMRRNVDLTVLLINNRIYGLTKGQYSPTSNQGQITSSTPLGVVDYPLNPCLFALTAGATFVARTMDTDPEHMGKTFEAAAKHEGLAFVEVYQNCIVFNDQPFGDVTKKAHRDDLCLYLDTGKPLNYGKDKLRTFFEGTQVHNPQCRTTAFTLAQAEQPTVFGVLYQAPKPTYNAMVDQQIKTAKETKAPDIDALVRGRKTWEVVSHE